MEPENLNLDDITEARRKSITETIRVVNGGELKALSEKFFPYPDHPWHEKLLAFIDENPSAAFHHAMIDGQIHVIYCDARKRGMWFLASGGVGILQQGGIDLMSGIVGELP